MHFKVDKIDQRILFELDRNARIPETKLAKIVGRSKESIRYRLAQLKQKGIIQRFTIWIDPTKLGYSSSKIYLHLANKPQQKENFIQRVKKDKHLFWLGIAEGSWNVGLTYFVQSTKEFFDLKNELFSEYKDLILDSHTAVLVNVNCGEKAFFYPTEKTWKTIFNQPERLEIDEIERKILKELFLNCRISLIEIARKSSSTVDIVRNRIKKLEEKGIIFRYTIRIDHNLLGHEFYKTFLYFKNLTKRDEQKLMEYTRKNSKIIYLVKQISPWDIELEIMCDNYQEYLHIINDLTREFVDAINKIETAIMSEDYIFPAEKMIFEE